MANFLHPTPERASSCAKGDITLAFCRSCGFIWNRAFDERRLVYEEGYQNPLHHSEVFRRYERSLAGDLVERFDLRGKTVVEIGCGDGRFLRLLCEIGGNRGFGFDPSYPAVLPARFDGIEIVRSAYSVEHADIGADFVCLRHTLEHVADPKTLLSPLRASLGGRDDVAVYIEVPNASHTLRNRFVWDIIYEHPSYFTPYSLPNVLERSGLESVRVYEAYSGQYLAVEARPGAAAGDASTDGPGQTGGDPALRPIDAPAARREIDDFVAGWRETVEEWRRRIDAFESAARSVVLWGAGSKAVTFLNLLSPRERVRCVVDLNPAKQGKFVPGSGHEIVAPDHLAAVRPDVVIAANPAYRAEIEKMIAGMNLRPELLSF